VIVDARLFDLERSTGSGPAQLTPILINDNLVDLTIAPAAAGSAAKIQWRPQSATLAIDAQVDTIAGGGGTKIDIRRAAPGRIVVRGRIAADRAPLVYVQEIENPARWARALLIEALGRAGVTVTASIHDDNPGDSLPEPADYSNLGRVAVSKSPPFSENVRLVLKVSHNLHASTLPLLVAARQGKRSLRDGLRLQHEFLKRAGLDADSISFGGGAGGARSDFTTPRTNVALLRYMATRGDFGVFERGLPILGVDGTIAGDVDQHSPARGRVRAKSGTFFWQNLLNDRFVLTSKALAGYLTAKSGRELAFSFVVGGVQIDNVNERKEIAKTLGRLCEIVCEAH
jgi:D-alanyl-D-alanine carboxypeptidase/D-alanyl-D-alanine-endopeptidase (penicillin-binding protein 4)